MNNNRLKATFTMLGATTFVSCSVKLDNNIIQSNKTEIGKTNNPQSLVITETIEQNNLIANKNNEDLSYLEQLTHQQINQYRNSRNLPSLKIDNSISQQARIHSQNMAQGKVPFSHEGFDKRIESVSSTISYRSAAENVAYNQGYSDPVEKAVSGWIKSPGHHKNMIGNYNLTGIGVAKNSQGEYYFTQIFVLGNKF